MKITQTDSFCPHNFVYFQIFILLLSALSVLCRETTAQDFKTVRDGIEYTEVTREIDKQPVQMNLLRLDLTKVRLDVVHAMDAAIGTEKTSSIATRYGAIAAINAGFFRLDDSIFAGDSVGVLMIDRKLLSESTNNRVILGIENTGNKTSIGIGHIGLFAEVKIGKSSLQLSGINRQRKDNEVLLYTPEFHRTTLTSSDGVEIIVRAGRVVRIAKHKGSSRIPQDGFVISASGNKQEEILGLVMVGTKISVVQLSTESITHVPREPDPSVFGIGKFQDMIAGVPQLIKDGKIDITWEQEKSSKSFVETRHPRTAVAKLKDGKFLMITIDGRSESSGGIGLYDLAALLLEFGATDAMNLDGGGSTTMFFDGKVVNHPSDKEGERKISDAILVFPRQKSAMQKPARE
jgi:exopolysaccharide biosynthesis protein